MKILENTDKRNPSEAISFAPTASEELTGGIDGWRTLLKKAD
jgi:hypothetical protein